VKGPPLLLTRAGQKDRRNPSAGPLASADLPAEQVTGAPIQFLVPPVFLAGRFRGSRCKSANAQARGLSPRMARIIAKLTFVQFPDYVQRLPASLQQPRCVSIRPLKLPFSNLMGLIVAEPEQCDSFRLVAVTTSEKNEVAFDS